GPDSRCPLSLHDALPIFRSSKMTLVADVPFAPLVIRMPLMPAPVMPVMLRLRRRTTAQFVLSEMMLMPLVPETRTEAKTSWQSRSEEHTSELQSPDHLVC